MFAGQNTQRDNYGGRGLGFLIKNISWIFSSFTYYTETYKKSRNSEIVCFGIKVFIIRFSIFYNSTQHFETDILINRFTFHSSLSKKKTKQFRKFIPITMTQNLESFFSFYFLNQSIYELKKTFLKVSNYWKISNNYSYYKSNI